MDNNQLQQAPVSPIPEDSKEHSLLNQLDTGNKISIIDNPLDDDDVPIIELNDSGRILESGDDDQQHDRRSISIDPSVVLDIKKTIKGGAGKEINNESGNKINKDLDNNNSRPSSKGLLTEVKSIDIIDHSGESPKNGLFSKPVTLEQVDTTLQPIVPSVMSGAEKVADYISEHSRMSNNISSNNFIDILNSQRENELSGTSSSDQDVSEIQADIPSYPKYPKRRPTLSRNSSSHKFNYAFLE